MSLTWSEVQFVTSARSAVVSSRSYVASDEVSSTSRVVISVAPSHSSTVNVRGAPDQEALSDPDGVALPDALAEADPEGDALPVSLADPDGERLADSDPDVDAEADADADALGEADPVDEAEAEPTLAGARNSAQETAA